MPHVDSHPAGAFCWAELGTTDAGAAKQFYGSLFGYEAGDMPMGEGGAYTMFKLQGREAAAAYNLMPEQVSQGVPPHWMVYFATGDADAGVSRCGALGGKLIAGPFDVFDAGRMVVLEDPAGAKFGLWQAKQHIGARIARELHCPAWPELASRDAARARDFYTGLMGWGAKEAAMPFPYTEWQLDGQSIGGLMQMTAEWDEMPSHWMVYFAVADAAASAAKAIDLGGTVCVPVTEIPGVGHFAVVNDPQGAVFSIIQLKEMV